MPPASVAWGQARTPPDHVWLKSDDFNAASFPDAAFFIFPVSWRQQGGMMSVPLIPL